MDNDTLESDDRKNVVPILKSNDENFARFKSVLGLEQKQSTFGFGPFGSFVGKVANSISNFFGFKSPSPLTITLGFIAACLMWPPLIVVGYWGAIVDGSASAVKSLSEEKENKVEVDEKTVSLL